MHKLIATKSRKDVEKARKRLDGARLSVTMPGVMSGEYPASEVLQRGFQLLSESRPRPALALADLIMAQVSDVVDVHLLRARALLEMEAVGLLDALVPVLLKAAPNNTGVLMVAARYYYLLGDASRSIGVTKQLLAVDANNVEALLHSELCFRYSGDTERAEKILLRCLKLSKESGTNQSERVRQYAASLLRLANYKRLDEEGLQSLRAMHAQSEDPILQSQSAYALASQAAKSGDKDQEITYLLAAKAMERTLWSIEASQTEVLENYQAKLASQRDVFSGASPLHQGDLPEASLQQAESQMPVFILGLPRSGTTLMEQILGGHSQVGQVGESKAFSLAMDAVVPEYDKSWLLSEYPAGLDRLPQQAFADIRRYIEKHQRVFTDKPLYIDKELSNFNYVGLMASLFPEAKFIHMDRAPMDIFLSCFRNSIPGVPQTASLEAMAEYYVYMKRLIGEWRDLLADRLLIINYQELVLEPEKFARQAVEFLGVEFELGMLDFHQRKNIVRTLSVDQVRQKIYTSSVEKWREYEEVLEPARAVMQAHGIPLQGVPYL